MYETLRLDMQLVPDHYYHQSEITTTAATSTTETRTDANKN
jgi:hypothetical protein